MSDKMQDMRIVASDEPKDEESALCSKNSLICCLSLVITVLVGMIYGMVSTDQAYTFIHNAHNNSVLPPFIPTTINPPATHPTDTTITTEPPASPVQGPNVDAMLRQASLIEDKINQYYGKDIVQSMQKGGFGVSPASKDYESGIKYVARNIIRAILDQNTYVVGVIGSSVAAGHDNCNYDSYERQLQRYVAVHVDFITLITDYLSLCGKRSAQGLKCVMLVRKAKWVFNVIGFD